MDVDGDTLVAIETPSPDRRVPPCPWDTRCGGCDLSALAPEARSRVLSHTLQWAVRAASPPEWVPSPRPHGHRARIKLAIEDGRLGYRAARTHALVPIDDCLVARDEIRHAIARLRTYPLDGFERVELRSDGARVVFAFEGRGRVPDLGDVAVNGKRVTGDPRLELRVGAVQLRASPRSFYQVNLEVNERLVTWVRDTVVGLRAERVLDLYAGIGNLSLPIAAAGIPVVAVELEGQAVGDLRARAVGLPVEVIGRDVGTFETTRTPFDVVVLDPPRAGAPGVLARVARQRPRAIVYVSCHLPTALRDLKEIRGAGYDLRRVCGFDMFPDTHHFETVLLLERR